MPRLPRPRLPRSRLPRPSRPRLRRLRREAVAGPPQARRPSRIGQSLRGLGYTIGDAAYAVGRFPLAVARGAREFWLSLSVFTRRRLVLAVGVIAAIAVIGLVAVPALPCQAPGGDVCPPADDAVGLVPEDALVYAHVNVDPGTEQYDDAKDVAGRIPALAAQATQRLLERLPGPGGGPPDFARDIQPWFGGEAAVAIVPVGGRAAEEVQLLEVSNDDAARKYAQEVATGQPRPAAYRDVQVNVDRRGLATAIVGGFLAIGRESGVRDVIDAQSGAKGTGSLADDPAADAARGALPHKRLADVYLSEDGIARLVTNPRGPLSTFGAVVNPGASRGVAAAAVASGDGLEVEIRSELDPARAKAHPGFFSAFPSFSPTLAGSLPEGSLGYVGIGNPGKTFQSLLAQATAEQPGLAAAVGDLVRRVRQLGGVNLAKDLLPTLGGEAAFALEPNPSKPGGQNGGQASPFLEFIGADVDTGQTSQALARLQGPIAKALNPGAGGQAPVFSQHKVGDVTSHSLQVSPTVDLTYAIVESALVVATDPAGIRQAVAGQGGLDGTDSYGAATDGLGGDRSVLAYLNLGGLVTLAEQAGLAEDPAYVTFAQEIRRLEAVGLAVRSSSDELATDARLIIGEGPGGGGPPSD